MLGEAGRGGGQGRRPREAGRGGGHGRRAGEAGRGGGQGRRPREAGRGGGQGRRAGEAGRGGGQGRHPGGMLPRNIFVQCVFLPFGAFIYIINGRVIKGFLNIFAPCTPPPPSLRYGLLCYAESVSVSHRKSIKSLCAYKCRFAYNVLKTPALPGGKKEEMTFFFIAMYTNIAENAIRVLRNTSLTTHRPVNWKCLKSS